MPLPDDSHERAELAAWLELTFTPGLGPVAARELLSAFGLPSQVLAAAHPALARIVGTALVEALRATDPIREERVAASMRWAQADGHHLLTLADADYPQPLLQIGDPPPVLHVAGVRQALSRPMLAVVGSRNATTVGLGHARAFARALSEAGLTIVSGLALGIDGAAHEGALLGGSGTVAVMGTGIDRIYPAAHLDLARTVVADGALVSELPLGARPAPGSFPRRNRLIAGLARGVLVVEAAVQSGSLITARQAGEFGREVFAIPGSIHSPLARGCHALIKQGAKLVESSDDVLSELGLGPPAVDPGGRGPSPRHGTTAAGPAADPLLAAVGHDPVLPDALAARLGLPVSEVSARLLALELDGRILRLSDGRVTRSPPFG